MAETSSQNTFGGILGFRLTWKLKMWLQKRLNLQIAQKCFEKSLLLVRKVCLEKYVNAVS